MYGISMNANRGPVASPGSISLPTAQAALTVNAPIFRSVQQAAISLQTARTLPTVYVAAVRRINFQLPPTRCRVWSGRIVNQASTSSDMVMLLTTVCVKAALGDLPTEAT